MGYHKLLIKKFHFKYNIFFAEKEPEDFKHNINYSYNPLDYYKNIGDEGHVMWICDVYEKETKVNKQHELEYTMIPFY